MQCNHFLIKIAGRSFEKRETQCSDNILGFKDIIIYK